jgi:hypothetical protein
MDIFPPWCFGRGFDPKCAGAAGVRTSSRLAAPTSLCGRTVHVRSDGLEQALFGERLRQVLVRADHPAAGAIEQPVLR